MTLFFYSFATRPAACPGRANLPRLLYWWRCRSLRNLFTGKTKNIVTSARFDYHSIPSMRLLIRFHHHGIAGAVG